MKVQFNRLFATVAIGLFSVAVSALPAAPQEAVKGHFTLPCEARWQNAILPAGEYTFVLTSRSAESPMTVTGPNGSVFELGHVDTNQPSGRPSVLILEQRGGTYFVREADLAGLGIQIRYNVPKQSRGEKELAQASNSGQILVAMATK
jgi:hypothetical protein